MSYERDCCCDMCQLRRLEDKREARAKYDAKVDEARRISYAKQMAEVKARRDAEIAQQEQTIFGS